MIKLLSYRGYKLLQNSRLEATFTLLARIPGKTTIELLIFSMRFVKNFVIGEIFGVAYSRYKTVV